ncbi:MAG: restriction endonuclease subunit S [Chloroflexi bacterium]|nr:restriction endonuclease subunit S [Chloroflexota bacterium]
MQGQYPYYGATGIIDYVNNFLFDGEYLLIGEDGAPFFLPQDVAFVASGKFWVNNHAHILKCKNENNIHFLKYCLNSVDYVEYITGSTRDKLTQSDLCRIKLPIPSLPEQQVIADFLDHKTAQIDTLIEKKQKQIELLQEEHKALINHAITKGLNPKVTMKDSGVEWLDEIPSHWEFVKTKYLFRLVTEKAPDDNEMELLSLYTEIGVRPRKDLEARGNKASTTDGYWIVKEGDIVVNKLLAWMGAVGYSAYDGVTSPAYDILRKTVPLNSKFYHYLLRCGIVLPEFKRRSRGIMEMRLRLYFDELGQIPLVYPPESEQNQIVEYLEDLEETVNRTISKITKEIELLQEYRMALIFESVTGKIDVRTAV